MVFNVAAYKEQINNFPDISYEEYQTITDLEVRKDIAKKNKIVQTDTYNRVMSDLKGPLGEMIETYGLYLRRSPNEKFNVIYWVKAIVEKILAMPITQRELDFADAYYKNQWKIGWVWNFNKKMWQKVIDENNWFLPLTIRAVKDGTVLKAKEPMMTVTGPWELAAVFEPLFLRAFYQSVVATDAAFIDNIIRSGRVWEYGKRAWINEESHMDAVESLIVAMWLTTTSSDAAALVFPELLTSGTTGHRYYAAYPSEDEGFINAVEKSERITLLVDLIDSYNWIDKVMKIKQDYRSTDKIIFTRLDSGDVAEQAVYCLEEQMKYNMMDPSRDKIVVEDISNIDQLRRVEDLCEKALEGTEYNHEDFIVYGLGGMLVTRNKTRDAVSAGYKLINTEDWATWKKSDDPDKEPIPGIPNIEIRNWKRYIVQEDEEVQGLRLLTKVYENWEFFFEEKDDLKAMKDARVNMKKTMEYIDFEQIESEATKQAKADVARRFGQIV